MTHSISFEGFKENFSHVITAAEATDLVDLLYRGPTTGFVLVGSVAGRNRRTRGTHMFSTCGKHVITVYRQPIEEAVKNHEQCGGNMTVPSNLRTGVMLTMAHEIQHANQFLLHGVRANDMFRHGKYRGRPNEVDARRFVDDNRDVILAFAGVERVQPTVVKNVKDRLDDVVDLFAELDEVNVDDVVEELRYVGENNPVSLRSTLSALRDAGTSIVG